PTIGNDWRYFGVFPNSNTGMTPAQVNGNQRYMLAPPLPFSGSPGTIRITGYGTTSSPVSLTWSQVQKTHSGTFTRLTGTGSQTVQYVVDTTGGNSGSPIEALTADQVIGIHTNAGCTSTSGANQGTGIWNPGLQTALANPLGIAGSGVGPASGDMYA